jgi:hypothetical protein
MTDAESAYLPWLRRGIATAITRREGDAGTVPRAKVSIAISLNEGSFTAKSDLTLLGSGDVTGLDPRSVIRVWPRAGVYDAASNFLPLLELDQADLPWRYTPARADAKGRLRPWLCLIALKRDEFELTQQPDATHPLPVISVEKDAPLPNLAQAWAWAHVQVEGTKQPTTTSVAAMLKDDSKRLIARLLCPRRLEARTPYTAFLVPTFERGRLAGLSAEPIQDSVDALQEAWATSRNAAVDLPYYYSWEFTSGEAEDFHALVRRLSKQPITTAGMRAMDVSDPGFGLSAATSPLGLEGALKAKEAGPTGWDDTECRAWIAGLKQLIDTPDNLLTIDGAGRRLALPLYGRWHVGRTTLGPKPRGRAFWLWFDELNADPRLRVAAAMGVRVVQSQQDQLLAGAWRQVEGIRELNAELRQAQAAREFARRVHGRHLAVDDPEVVLQLSGPVHARLAADFQGLTVPSYLGGAGAHPGTPLRPGVLAPQWRRISRRTGPIARRQGRPLEATPIASTLLTRLATGELRIAPPPRNPAAISRLGRLGSVAPGDLATADGGGPGFEPREYVGERLAGWANAPARAVGGDDSPGGAEFRAAVTAGWPLLAAPDPPPIQLTTPDLTALRTRVVEQLDPETTIAELYDARVERNASSAWDPQMLEPIMAAPTFSNPMFEPLRELSQEWVFPGLDQVPPNSMSLLATNNRFIYAYMVGLNYEFGRELLWNGYPTDQRGTYFKQFWDPAMYYGSLTPAQLRDIDDIADWPVSGKESQLELAGKQPGSGAGDRIVLLLRGDLLARYPNLIVFAAKATLRSTGGNVTEPGDREPDDTNEKQPLFAGTLKPDVSFFAFDILEGDVKADAATNDAGWYFVLQEQPSETRFNFNTDVAATVASWADLAWSDLTNEPTDGYIDLDENEPTAARRPPAAAGAPTWPTSSNSATAADMAMIVVQRQVRIAVHGSDMVP